ncbi:MAG: ATPase, T2SS/T4P/T4SS family [Candidatus Omnitrophota bacterium]|nr:ATPase, T2SS/T4P/T4SS family [Candidatus Omnitrophota bacterium]
MPQKRLKLGEILIKKKLINEEQLKEALKVQQQDPRLIGELLVKLKMVEEKDIVVALGEQLGIPYALQEEGLSKLNPAPDQDLDLMIPEDFARRYRVLPLSKHLNSLTAACTDPLDLLMLDNLRKLTGCEINLVITPNSDLQQAVDKFYGHGYSLREAISASYEQETEREIETTKQDERLSLDELVARAEEAPVVKLVDLILKQAVEERASDIHIEPFRDKMTVRYRVDGMLYETSPPSKSMFLALVSRIKILAKLDIAEKRLPQDGAFTVKTNKKTIDLRVSVIPSIYGEKIVLRILDRTRIPLNLKKLGFGPKIFEDFEKAINSPYGLIFLTGPTGCGKTTTLYAALESIKSPHKNIITLEDPVEYRLDGINQVQVKPQIGLTFANGLRAFLRQDPDVILVGEVRDLETAQICIRASLTGHLVLSTLHTNDALSAITRLTDIGIEPFLLAASLRLVAAQRLVRKLCPECKQAYEPSAEEKKTLGANPELLYRSKGCDKCGQKGYSGRIAILEVVPMTGKFSQLISSKAAISVLRQTAREMGIKTLWNNCLSKVAEGVTSMDEVMSGIVYTGEE